MPWLVSIRISGQVNGAPFTTATRRSVIFRSDGCEFRLTFCTAASRVGSAQKLAPSAAAADPRNRRRPNPADVFMRIILLPNKRRAEGAFRWCYILVRYPSGKFHFTQGDIRVRVGVFTALLAQLSLEDVLKKLKSLNIATVELGTGNYPGDPHCKLSMLENKADLTAFKQKLSDYGFSISALSCHGNPLHPNPAIAKANQEVNRKTIMLAAKLGVPVVIDFAGCPGDSDKAKYPNWVTCPWPPEYLDVLDWQWEKKVIPYWTKRAKFAEDHGVKIAIEMHPGFVAYSPETMLRLRSAAGKAIGVNYDPSHMFWQGIDPIAAVRVLGNAIFHVHAKDTQIYDRN